MTDAHLARRRGNCLIGQTVVVIGGSAGIGLETARRARAEGADVILTGRDHERLEHAATEVGAQSVAAFDATRLRARSSDVLRRAGRADRPRAGHGPGRRTTAPLAEIDFDEARRDLEAHLLLTDPGRAARDRARCARAATLLFMGGTGGRQHRRRASALVSTRHRRDAGARRRTSRSSSRRSGST